jgi:hypothetical protein
LDSVGFSQEQGDEKNSMDVKSVSENWKTTQNEERERNTDPLLMVFSKCFKLKLINTTSSSGHFDSCEASSSRCSTTKHHHQKIHYAMCWMIKSSKFQHKNPYSSKLVK